MTTFTITDATPDDIEIIASFNEQMALETEGKRLDPERIRAGVGGVFDVPGRGFYLVARAGDEPVGCLLVTFEWSDWRNGLIWWIQSVFVRADWRRRGVYRALYSALEPRARASGAIGFRLYVEDENSGAQDTYEALGMRHAGYQVYEDLLDP